MPDRRVVDDLTIEELEQVLRIKKRQARLERLRNLEQIGRKRAGPSPVEDSVRLSEEEEESGLAYESFLREDKPARVSWKDRSLRDKLLLAVEMGAALTLFGVLIYAALALEAINREASSAQQSALTDLPTATVTPILGIVVLPSGHTPPINGQEPQPNYDEVPSYLRPNVVEQYSGPVIEPTIGPSMAERIKIPAIGVDAPVVQGDGWEQLKKGVGQHIGTGNPGDPGNMVLSAHNDIYGQIFRYLEKLNVGDKIIIQTHSLNFTYSVTEIHYVDPTNVSVMAPSHDPIVTLVSCYPYMIDNQRIVVIAELVQ